MRASILLLVALFSVTGLFASQPKVQMPDLPTQVLPSLDDYPIVDAVAYPITSLFSNASLHTLRLVQDDRVRFMDIEGFERMAIEDAWGNRLMLGVLDGRSAEIEIKVAHLESGLYNAVFTGDFYHPTKVVSFVVSR